ncbi:MAG: hypothetical protein JW878_11190 [Methanomicrobia archaeon]|nr:hypothetical protein [Methanomicrobia archaeon]
MTIVVHKKGKSPFRLERSSFANEEALQNLIQDSPNAIPVDHIDDGAKLLTLRREFPTSVGPIDAIGVDQRGNLYLIETKLYRNSDKRQVVAQVLDYGAALWTHSGDFDRFMAELEADTQQRLNINIGEHIRSFFELSEEQYSDLVDAMHDNFVAAQFRFLILMDSVHDALRDLILFLNQNSNFDVYAVELDHYEMEDTSIVVPRIIGSITKKQGVRTSGKRRPWTMENMLQDAKEKLESDIYDSFYYLYEFCDKNSAQMNLGTGTLHGSFSPVFPEISDHSLITVRTDGLLTLNFGWLHDNHKTEAKAAVLREKLVEAGFIFKTEQQFPGIAPESWTPRVEALIYIIEEIRK